MRRSSLKGDDEEAGKGKVYSHMTMSLDGLISNPDDGCDELFDWYGAGEVTVPNATEGSPFEVDEHSAVFLREVLADTGALVRTQAVRHHRRLGRQPSRRCPRCRGHPRAAGRHLAAQALDLGLLDGVSVSLVPVLMGAGIPYFASLTAAPHRFDDPVVVQGRRATHLTYAVRR
jgi:hypothetical protein